MEYLNRIELRGVVGSAKLTTCGTLSICNFSLLTEYAYKGESGCLTIDSMWWTVIVIRSNPALPALCEIQKGTKVYVQGRVRTKRYCDAQGNDRTVYEVVAQELKIVE